MHAPRRQHDTPQRIYAKCPLSPAPATAKKLKNLKMLQQRAVCRPSHFCIKIHKDKNFLQSAQKLLARYSEICYYQKAIDKRFNVLDALKTRTSCPSFGRSGTRGSRKLAQIIKLVPHALMVKRLRRRPLTAESRVRFPMGVPAK